MYTTGFYCTGNRLVAIVSGTNYFLQKSIMCNRFFNITHNLLHNQTLSTTERSYMHVDSKKNNNYSIIKNVYGILGLSTEKKEKHIARR